MAATQQTAAWRARRSILFMPASNKRALAKITELKCDGVILDLEDSVSGEEQEEARVNLITLVKGKSFENKEIIIRVSAPTSAQYSRDVITAIACGIDAILVPKVADAGALNDLNAMLAYSGADDIQIWAMIETAKALTNLSELIKTSENLSGLVVGPNDLARETGVSLERGRQYLIPWLMEIVAQARANSLVVLDGVLNRFDDEIWLKEECEQGSAMGFDGKTLIHPKQIDAANSAFSPSKSDIDFAQEVVALFSKRENLGKSALQLHGEMVEKLHFENAQKLLALAKKLT